MLNIGLKQRMPVPAGQLGPVAGSHAILMALGTVALVVDDFLSVGLLTTQSTHRPLASEPPAAEVQSRRPLKVSPPERLSVVLHPARAPQAHVSFWGRRRRLLGARRYPLRAAARGT